MALLTPFAALLPGDGPGLPQAPGSPPMPGPPAMSPAPTSPLPPVATSADLPDYDTTIKFGSDKDREEFGNKLVTKIRESLSRLTDRHDLIRLWREQYEAKSYPKDFPWPNAASLNIPTTRRIVDTIHSELYNAVTAVDPLFRLEAYAAEDQDLAANMERVLQWQLADQVDLPAILRRAYKDALIDGTSILKVCWRKEAHRTRKPGIRTLPAGQTMQVLVEETDYTVNQPDVIPIDVLDFVLYPANARSIESAIGVGHRFWRTADDLRRGVRDEVYDSAQVDALLKAGADQPQTGAEMNGGDAFRDGQEGVENGDAYDSEDRTYQLFEVIWKYDSDGDGIMEDCLFVVEMSTGRLIRAEAYPFWHNQRCFVDVTPDPRPKRFFGFSLPEKLESLHSEINAIRNQRVDAGTLYLSPVLAARRGVKFDFGKQRWRPGAVLYMDDPANDVRPISFQNVSQAAFSEEQFAREQAEAVTGASDYAQGQSPSRSRTLGEVSSVMAQGGKRAALLVAEVQRSNQALAEQVLGLDRQYLDPQTEYSLTRNGQRAFAQISRADMETRVRIVPHGNGVNGNQEFELQKWETLFQMAQTCPLMQSPTRMYEIMRGVLGALRVLNVVPIIGTEQQAEQAEQKAAQAGPPPPPPPQLAGKLDEAGTLALMFKEQQITAQQYEQAATLLAHFTVANSATDAMVSGAASQADAAHKAELAKNAAEHQAMVGTGHALVQQAAGNLIDQATAPQATQIPAPAGGASASPMPAPQTPPTGGSPQ